MRIRRYRLFLAVAVLSVISIYQVTNINAWDSSSLENLVRLKTNHAGKPIVPNADPPAQPFSVPVSAAAPGQPTEHPAQSAHPASPPKEFRSPAPSSSATPEATSSSTSFVDPQPTVTGEELLTKQSNPDDESGERGEGRYEVQPRPVGGRKAYWRQQKENFPVPSHGLTLLPSGEPKALPRVQYEFGDEQATVKADRVQKQTIIREAFKHAWFGYKNHSMPHDELRPISGQVGDPFNGWGATLVDSLDTLWIMALYDEFQDAVTAVAQIDFKTSARKDIPLFETVIRYLGGLIAAYDLSSGKYPILLDKAVELADILMGAFDTPNRMPAVFYNWAPSYASQPHRGSTHTVLAEIGSLSVEFTRLAQLTREHKYYDAISRITDALEKWQMKTTLPGLWPLRLDASGCKKPESITTSAAENQSDPEILSAGSEALDGDKAKSSLEKTSVPDHGHNLGGNPSDRISKRQQFSSAPPQEDTTPKITNEDEKLKAMIPSPWDEEDLDGVDCEPQGLSTEPHWDIQTYGIGSMADSTYEYFPKEYALLGGLNPQYRTMYLDAMEVVRDELLFRPMTKQNHDILFLAKQNVSPRSKNPAKRKEVIYEGTHLGCYAGGMFALGSQLFDIPSDMIIAERLTNGCVWAYGSMPAGIMPEEFELLPCDSLNSCKWDEEKWHAALDPRPEERVEAVEQYNLNQQKLYMEALIAAETPREEEHIVSRPVLDHSLSRRGISSSFEMDDTPTRTLVSDQGDTGMSNSKPKPFVPMVPMSHEKYVEAKVQEQRLPPGYTKITARDYRLRPEAIESVFIMYRVTGDSTWRDKGWTMFQAVDKLTRTEIAHAGIKDVTSQLQEQQDTMESFWLAETLKYYYLLFSEPDLISLDDYVL